MVSLRFTPPSTRRRIALEEGKCKEIADDAEADLALALPALEKAMSEVDKLDSASISEVKAYTTPPALVGLVLSGVMTIFGVGTDWVSGAGGQRTSGRAPRLRHVRFYFLPSPAGLCEEEDRRVGLPPPGCVAAVIC